MAVTTVVREARLVRFWCSVEMLSVLTTPHSGSNSGIPGIQIVFYDTNTRICIFHRICHFEGVCIQVNLHYQQHPQLQTDLHSVSLVFLMAVTRLQAQSSSEGREHPREVKRPSENSETHWTRRETSCWSSAIFSNASLSLT